MSTRPKTEPAPMRDGAPTALDSRRKNSQPVDQLTFEDLVRTLARRPATESQLGNATGPATADPAAVVLRTVYEGSQYSLVRETAPVESAGGPSPALSPREQEIARMVAKGYPNKAIAAVLEISEWTVGSHLRRIFAKLQVTSRAAMVTQCLRFPTRTSFSNGNVGPAISENSQVNPSCAVATPARTPTPASSNKGAGYRSGINPTH